MLTVRIDGLEGLQEALDMARLGEEILRVAMDAIDVELAGIMGQVIDEIDAAKAVGATKLYRQSIAIVPAERTETGVAGGVYAGKTAGEQLIQANVMETGAKPHAKKKHPYFWIRTLEDWVARKIGSVMSGTGSYGEFEEIKLKKTSGRLKKTGNYGEFKHHKTKKQKTADSIRNALAVAIGRKIEEDGIAPRRPFGKAFDAMAEAAAERIVQKIDDAIELAISQGRAA